MITIPIGLDEETVAKIDALVTKGIYKNRTEALREQIVKGIAKFELIFDNFADSEEYCSVLQEMLTKWSIPPNLLPSKQTIEELVSEGRER